MQPEMARERTIQVANPEADQARPEAIAIIAIAAWGLGIVLTLGLARVMPAIAGSDAASDSVGRAAVAHAARAQLPVASAIPTHGVKAPRDIDSVPAPSVPAAPVARRAPEPIAATQAARPTPVAAQPPPAAAPKPAITPAAPAAAPLAASAAKHRTPKRELEQGVIAYVRCDGAEQRGARFPCPRDRKLEEQVWRTLDVLTTCDTDPGRGGAELRLTLRRSQIHAVEWKPSAPGPGLNLRAVSKCTGAKLADARTRLKAPEGLVSFRFSLK